MRCLPKQVPSPPKIRREKPWNCPNPNCKEPFSTVYDGENVQFNHLGRMFALCGGTYERVQVRCPKCGEWAEFTKEELEKAS